jgi:hypothetical protein
LDLKSLKKVARSIKNPIERAEAIHEVQIFEDQILTHQSEAEKLKLAISTPYHANIKKPTWIKMFFITILFGLMAYCLGEMALKPILVSESYTERSTRLLITLASNPIKYWLAVAFFAIGTVFMSLITLGCIIALITYPVPPVQLYKEYIEKAKAKTL